MSTSLSVKFGVLEFWLNWAFWVCWTRTQVKSVGVEHSSSENVHYRITGLCGVSKCTSVPLGIAVDVAGRGSRVLHIYVDLS